MLKAVSAAAVLIAAAGASGAAFSLNSVDLGGDAASFGEPITVTGGSYFQDGFGNNYPPSSMFIGIVPTLEWDSYIAMDDTGRSTASRTANAPGGSTPGFSSTGGHFADASTLTGGYFTGGGVPSGFAPSGNDGVMIAQLTIDAGQLAGENIRVAIDGEGGNAVSLVLDGSSVAGPVSGRPWAAKSYLTNQGASGLTYEIWVEEIPAPGAAALFGLAGFAAARRRRA